jgi:hypothetical protein
METGTWREPDPATLLASERRSMAAILGIGEDDPAIDALHAIGFRPSTVALLDLLPLVELAWADGRVSPRERQAVTGAAARRRDVGGSAHTQLGVWLQLRPAESLFHAGRRILGSILSRIDARAADRLRSRLATETALFVSPHGGLLGTEPDVSDDLRRVLHRLRADIRRPSRVSPAAGGGIAEAVVHPSVRAEGRFSRSPDLAGVLARRRLS